MISCVEWVPEGAADPNPKRFELSKAEMEMLEEQVNMAEEAYKADDANTDASSVEDADDNAASSGGGKIELETVDTGYTAIASVDVAGSQQRDERCWTFGIETTGRRWSHSRSGEDTTRYCWKT